MANSLHPLLAFNGGEEILAADFEDSTWLQRRHLIDALHQWEIGTAIGMASSSKPDGFLGPNGFALPTDEVSGHIWMTTPAPVFNPTSLLSKTLANLTTRLLKARTSFLSDEAGELHQIHLDESDAALTAATFPAGIPAANPRWDSLELDFLDAYGDTESRDTEDASTRALTTGTPNKRINTTLQDVAWVSGAEAALPDFPALSSGDVARLISIKRIVGEGGTVLRDAFAFHPNPTRIGVEEIVAANCGYDPTYWTPGAYGELVRQSGSLTSGNLHFVSRKMHAGCRLLAVGVCWFIAGEPSVSITRYTYGSAAAPTLVVIADEGTGGTIDHQDGLKWTSEAHWSINAAIASGTECGYPIWGNGRTYGPMFLDQAAGARYVSRLGIALSGASNPWTAGDAVHFVRLVYAY